MQVFLKAVRRVFVLKIGAWRDHHVHKAQEKSRLFGVPAGEWSIADQGASGVCYYCADAQTLAMIRCRRRAFSKGKRIQS